MLQKTKEAPKKGDITRLAIEDAAFELFMEQGYHATSMRQIADKAKLALGGIYNHFSSKEEIFSAILMDKHPYKQILPIVLAVEGDTAEKLIRNAARALVTELGSRPEVLKLVFIELVEFNGKHIANLVGEIAPRLFPMFEKMIHVRKNLRKIPPPILARSFLGMFFSFYITELFIQDSLVATLMPENSFDLFVDIYLHGVIKEKA
ncbi:MAG TPA: TetR/AcrR family transcriptional regulator [Anaerolineales bacterium]|nr:TetR/AcrR family transcriptional regulator [Anaerolineales bacterium]HLO34392.1 TetR/AcrR family transcriptional regulator [Anaerolineales bacterium]